MRYLISCFALLAFFLLVPYGATAEDADLPVVDLEKDHALCLKRGFKPVELEDPQTLRYYTCRIEQTRRYLINNKRILGILTPAEKSHNITVEGHIADFTKKHKAAESARRVFIDKERRKWNKAQEEMAKSHDKHDHNFCAGKGLDPSTWGSPDTEQYYLCRLARIESRATPLPDIYGIPKKVVPPPAAFFHKKAKEARYAFRAIDYESHVACANKGLQPGELQDPKTEAYYHCRADIAEKRAGSKVTLFFRQKAEKARHEAEEHRPCARKGIKPGSPTYSHCRKAVIHYKQCIASVPAVMADQKDQDIHDCAEHAKLSFPDHLKEVREKEVISRDRAGNVISSNLIKDIPEYTPKQLNTLREKAYDICIRDKKLQWKNTHVSLELECSDIMNINKPL